MINFRWFPFLGFKTLSAEENELYDIPVDRVCKALVFEWLWLQVIITGKVYMKDDDGN